MNCENLDAAPLTISPPGGTMASAPTNGEQTRSELVEGGGARHQLAPTFFPGPIRCTTHRAITRKEAHYGFSTGRSGAAQRSRRAGVAEVDHPRPSRLHLARWHA